MRLKNIGLAVGAGLLLGVALPVRAQVFTLLHNFTNTPDGANPRQLAGTNGLLYGATANGGTNGSGLIFRFNLNVAAFSTVYNFTGATNNGNTPNNLLVAGNMIYGTTVSSGTNGVGMIFAVNTNGTGFKSLHSFGPPPVEYSPQAGLILNGATLYGTTYTGGTNFGGTVFKINTNGTGYTVLHWFTNTPDGYSPQSELVLSGSTLFGTTTYGGTNGYGTIFSVKTNGASYTILRSFTNAPDGRWPYGGLVLNSGILYGTTSSGGSNNPAGTIFAINTNGSGYKTIYHFTAITGNNDGWQPRDTLTINGSNLYGTASQGGTGGKGTIFEINTNGTGYSVLKSFTNSPADGATPVNGVTVLGTNLWGTTYSGGDSNYGILFKLLLSPVITLQPQSMIITNGDSATFTTAATGAGLLNYQWFFRTNNLIAGATNTALIFTNAITNLAGFYSVRVTNTFGSVTSSFARLTISNRPNLLAASFDPASGSYSFAYANIAKSTNRLWASTNLSATNFWRAIATNVMATNGLWFFTDLNSAKTNNARFYRFSTP